MSLDNSLSLLNGIVFEVSVKDLTPKEGIIFLGSKMYTLKSRCPHPILRFLFKLEIKRFFLDMFYVYKD